jgi:Z1 domain-containing protein
MISALENTTAFLDIALDMLRKTKPRDLEESIRWVADNDQSKLPPNLREALVQHIDIGDPNDRILHSLAAAIQGWDHEESPNWADETGQYTAERRSLILKLLGFDPNDEKIINGRIPRFSETEVAVIIAGSHQPWYGSRKPDIRDYYWRDYKSLLSTKTWIEDAIQKLDNSTDDVLSRLSDPTSKEIYPAKGLVMGYVQSGKTAHFSGLIAKAADAGYRLIIVLAGTLDILRQQTQRRLDMEIVGRELLEPEEYGMDAEWDRFVSHGALPSSDNSFDWERLTDKNDDYKTLKHLRSVLDFKRIDPTKPFNHPDNLRNASVKLAIIKKVPSRITKLSKDLKRLRELRSKLEHVPTLIIDDEADQASVNTIDQSKPGKKGKRTSTNREIGELLRMLPRAQYVGYTATPFANVFIDPEDADDLFPKDFIVSLPRPDGYMGVSDFFDFDIEYPEGDFKGKKNAFVREVEGEHEDSKNLPKAIDSFILSGAIKLYREAKDQRFSFKHHTMLVHHSHKKIVHEEDKEIVEKIFLNGARYNKPKDYNNLRKLFYEDFVPVSKIHASELPFPKNFNELKPYINRCLTKVCSGKAVRIVNGDSKHRDDTPEFDQAPVWAILVGGAKLSRGYTVEGLTVSYYRRPTMAGDTLMQMGRWFGFRLGYMDLVRLFIGSKETRGNNTINLYETFRAVCNDEESLRKELLKYSKDGLLPKQVPPLVWQTLPYLPPTSKNKMFNAVMKSRNFAGDWTEKTIAPSKTTLIEFNKGIAANLLENAQIGSHQELFTFVKKDGNGKKDQKRKFSAYIGKANGSDVLSFLKDYKWADERKPIYLEIDYIGSMLAQKKLVEWTILLPQVGDKSLFPLPNSKIKDFSYVKRQRDNKRFGVYSEPRHREAAAFLSGVANVQNPNRSLMTYRDPEAPVLVMYFVQESNSDNPDISVGFGTQYPGQKAGNAIEWMVRDKNNEDAVVVEKQ